ncbi:pH-responsive protein 1 [Cyphellophora attinorum]|uniref:1,3-beta-glucanosyltransferase n=1 Tax=Cyphellophora attinorum TaxID=1664694 RepID=A0A0N1H5H9_9EURO|nr:pH-responsive protein 1 [Phialophora attinorum]KPI37653.1 pH-responsive protein 1 [Phialophora attinorum]
MNSPEIPAGNNRPRVSPLSISQNRFLLDDGKIFIFRGVVYQIPSRRRAAVQPETSDHVDSTPKFRFAKRDALNDDRYEAFARDVALFEELSINCLWIYLVAPEVSHARCMALLAEKGIYVFIGLWTPLQCINRMAPRESYNHDLLKRSYSVVNAFRGYSNVAGFVAADHVVNNVRSTVAAEVVMAVVRDVKCYMRVVADRMGGRVVPVGVADAEWAAIESPSPAFYTAGSKQQQVDFYAFTNYQCWPSTAEDGRQKWRALLGKLKAIGVPVVVSEYGNNSIEPRSFDETIQLYGDEMRAVVSGGFVYEFTQEANRYGLVVIEDGSAVKLPDFATLRAKLSEVKELLVDSESIAPASNAGGVQDFPPTTSEWLAGSKPMPSPLPVEHYLDQETEQ